MEMRNSVNNIDKMFPKKKTNYDVIERKDIELNYIKNKTTDIKTNLSPEGFGKITLGYDISLQGSDQGRNEIEIEILQ